MKGDWAPGAKLVDLHIEMDVDENGMVVHAGCSYNVQVPSGAVHSPPAITVHSPGQQIYASHEIQAKLKEVADELAKAAAEHEGVGEK